MSMLSSSRTIAFLLIAIFIFFATNFSPPMLGVIYVLMLFVYALVVENIFPEVPLTINTRKSQKLLILLGGGAIIWLFLSVIVLSNSAIMSMLGLNVVNIDFKNTESIIGLMASSTSPPVITEDPYIYLFVFGLLIPIAESMFFLGALLPFAEKVFRRESKYIRWGLSIVVIGAVVSLWHYTSHIFNDYALIIDFIFFAVSSCMVLSENDLRSATLLHILWNCLVVSASIGWIVV